jgi:hypothetical protein
VTTSSRTAFQTGWISTDGYVVSDIDANTDTLSFTNGVQLTVGDATGDVNEATLRRIQIREAIKAHFDKEQALFQQGVKVLTLFFIDEVAKYRDYAAADEKGEYARTSKRNTTIPERSAGPGRDGLRQVPQRAFPPRRRTAATSPSTRRPSAWLTPTWLRAARTPGSRMTWMPTT